MRETAERLADGMWLRRTWYDADRVRSETVVADRNGATLTAFLELPDEPSERGAVRRAVGPGVRAAGYDVEDDLGQRFMFIRIK